MLLWNTERNSIENVSSVEGQKEKELRDLGFLAAAKKDSEKMSDYLMRKSLSRVELELKAEARRLKMVSNADKGSPLCK